MTFSILSIFGSSYLYLTQLPNQVCENNTWTRCNIFLPRNQLPIAGLHLLHIDTLPVLVVWCDVHHSNELINNILLARPAMGSKVLRNIHLSKLENKQTFIFSRPLPDPCMKWNCVLFQLKKKGGCAFKFTSTSRVPILQMLLQQTGLLQL